MSVEQKKNVIEAHEIAIVAILWSGPDKNKINKDTLERPEDIQNAFSSCNIIRKFVEFTKRIHIFKNAADQCILQIDTYTNVADAESH